MGRSSSDHVAQLVASQRHVERKFEPETFFGPIGAAAVRRLSARSSCHAYPFGVSLQVALLGWRHVSGVVATVHCSGRFSCQPT